jgi:hypothetical protein
VLKLSEKKFVRPFVRVASEGPVRCGRYHKSVRRMVNAAATAGAAAASNGRMSAAVSVMRMQ